MQNQKGFLWQYRPFALDNLRTFLVPLKQVFLGQNLVCEVLIRLKDKLQYETLYTQHSNHHFTAIIQVNLVPSVL